MEYVSYIVTVITIIGTIANSFQKWWCFIIWIATNTFWIIYNLAIKEYQQAIIYFVNDITSIIGIINWRRKDKEMKNGKLQ